MLCSFTNHCPPWAVPSACATLFRKTLVLIWQHWSADLSTWHDYNLCWKKSVVSFCLRTSNVSTIITLNRNFTQWSKWLKPVVKSTLSCGRIDSCMVKLTGDPAIPYIILKRRVRQSASRRFAENSWVKRLLSEHKSSWEPAWQVAAVKSLSIMQDLKDSIISNFCYVDLTLGQEGKQGWVPCSVSLNFGAANQPLKARVCQGKQLFKYLCDDQSVHNFNLHSRSGINWS